LKKVIGLYMSCLKKRAHERHQSGGRTNSVDDHSVVNLGDSFVWTVTMTNELDNLRRRGRKKKKSLRGSKQGVRTGTALKGQDFLVPGERETKMFEKGNDSVGGKGLAVGKAERLTLVAVDGGGCFRFL